MEKYSESNVDEEMFRDNTNWDTQNEFFFDGTHFIKKCKAFLGINWCYCKANDMPLPMPCFGHLQRHIKHIKNNDAVQEGYNQYYYDNDNDYNNNNNQMKVDEKYFANDANWNFVSSSSSYGTQENMQTFHGDLYGVTKKCKQMMSGSWTCYCQGLDHMIFTCNASPSEIGKYITTHNLTITTYSSLFSFIISILYHKRLKEKDF